MKFSAGYTIIELIFVMVIIGIVAAVGIPKLAATRDDSRASVIATRLANCITLASKGYLMNNIFDINDSNCVEVVNKIHCYQLTPDDSNGTLKVEDVADANSACKAAQKITLKNKLSSPVGIIHSF